MVQLAENKDLLGKVVAQERKIEELQYLNRELTSLCQDQLIDIDDVKRENIRLQSELAQSAANSAISVETVALQRPLQSVSGTTQSNRDDFIQAWLGASSGTRKQKPASVPVRTTKTRTNVAINRERVSTGYASIHMPEHSDQFEDIKI
jgi:hypothetical protein